MMDPSTTPVSGTPGGSKPATPSSNDSRVPLDLAALVSDGEKEAELTTDPLEGEDVSSTPSAPSPAHRMNVTVEESTVLVACKSIEDEAGEALTEDVGSFTSIITSSSPSSSSSSSSAAAPSPTTTSPSSLNRFLKKEVQSERVELISNSMNTTILLKPEIKSSDDGAINNDGDSVTLLPPPVPEASSSDLVDEKVGAVYDNEKSTPSGSTPEAEAAHAKMVAAAVALADQEDRMAAALVDATDTTSATEGGAESGSSSSELDTKTLVQRLKNLSTVAAERLQLEERVKSINVTLDERVNQPVAAWTAGARAKTGEVIEAGTEKWKSVVESAAPKIEAVRTQYREEGLMATTKTVTGATMSATWATAQAAVIKVREGVDGLSGTLSESERVKLALEAAKPYVDRVKENPTVGKIVGSVQASAVGVGSMVSTTAVATQELMNKHTGNTPELRAQAAKLEAEEAEAWRMVLHPDGLIATAAAAAAAAAAESNAEGMIEGEAAVTEQKEDRPQSENAPPQEEQHQRRGEEMVVPARTEHTSMFFVEKGGTISWSFRVAYLNVARKQPLDVGFAVKLRVQGDGGSIEVDVFAMQKYSSGVTVHGEWSPEADSAIVLVWDNTYSFLREKKIAFQAHVTKAPIQNKADEFVETIEGGTQTSRGNSPAVTPPPMLNAAGDKAAPMLPLEEPESVTPAAAAAVIAELVKADESEEGDRSDAPPNNVEAEMGDGNDGDGAANSALEGSKKKNKKKKNKKKKEESAP